jgi:hypothetical protein
MAMPDHNTYFWSSPRPGKPSRLGDALGEGTRGYGGLDGDLAIAIVLLRFDQGLANATIPAHLGVDRLAEGLELLLMLIPGCVIFLAISIYPPILIPRASCKKT